MAGWHTRAWRRVRLAPGLTINLSKSGPSVSVGPRGSKVTFSRRGVRETVGVPGTGLYATRQLSEGGRARSAARTTVRSAPAQAPAPAAPPAPRAPVGAPPAPGPAAAAVTVASMPDTVAASDDQVEIYYGFATLVGVIFGIALLLLGLPTGEALLGGVAAIVAGIVYEGLAHHHPGPAKVVAQVVVGLAALATVIGGALLVVILAVALGGLGGSSRRRRRR
jgi:hypothetical protein